jgi:hypothetical protein
LFWGHPTTPGLDDAVVRIAAAMAGIKMAVGVFLAVGCGARTQVTALAVTPVAAPAVTLVAVLVVAAVVVVA